MLPPELDCYRLDRYRTRFNLPRSVKLTISPLDRTLLISAPQNQLQRLQNQIVDLRIEAWFIAAACQISLFRENNLIHTALTQLQPIKTIAELRGITTQIQPMVATATRRTTTAPQLDSQKPTVPVVRGLGAIAQNTGVPEEKIASEIVGLGNFAFYDSDAGLYKADEAGISVWVDEWLDRDREARKAQLFQIETTNGKVEAPPELAPKPKKMRFKDFAIANSYSKTIGNFLDAQGYSAEDRTAIVEQLANLPKEAADTESLPEQVMNKVLSKYPAAKRSEARRSIIRSIKKDMLGKPTEPEAAATTAE